jgi:biopolymer transport protein ExbB
MNAVSILPAALSPYDMFMQSDAVVKAVMTGLFAASLLAWIVLLAKKMEIFALRRTLSQGLARVEAADTLLAARHSVTPRERVAFALVEAALDEMNQAAGQCDSDGVKERISIRFGRIEAAAAREASRGISLLATIGSTAPFIGLFGTVWGIMNAFIGISKAQTTNLAVVAPGIAEALLATAIGLVAAIPAVIFYNHLSRAVVNYRALMSDLVASVAIRAGRDIAHPPSLRIAAE